MIKAVIFDLDGTLIDTEKYYRRFWPMALEQFGYHMTDEQALSMRSLGRPFAPQRLKEMFGPELDYYEVRRVRTQMMEECLDREGVVCKAGAAELVDRLREAGIITAIATATPIERAEKYLRLTGLSGRFNRVISATMVAEGKPSPDIYLYACQELGLAPEQCFAVEDSPNGILSAYRAGCHVIMVPDQTQPEKSIEKYLYRTVNSLADVYPLSIDF